MANKARHQTGAAGLVDRVTHMLDRGGRRGARSGRRGSRERDRLTGRAASFVAGFLSGGDDRRNGRGRRRRR